VSPLRFAMITTFYPPYNFGGDGIAVQRLARALVRRGHHVTVIHDADAYNSLSRRPDPAAPAEGDGVNVVPLKSGLGIVSPFLTQQIGRPVMNGRRIRSILDEGRFDVINYNNVSLVGGPGVLSLGQGLKVYIALEHWLVCPTHVLWRHQREPCPSRQCLRCVLRYHRPPQLWRYTGLLERRLREHVDVFIALSEFSRDKHHEFGLRHEMEVVPGFLPQETAGPQPEPPPLHGRPYFLFLGRLTRIKGLHDVIPVFREQPVADLVVAGDGEEAGALRELAGGSPAIHFKGRVPSESLPAWYRHALALIVPSAGYETFGFVLVEAFQQGTPVIARRIGPLPEMVTRCQGGELFSSPGELLASLRRLATDAEHRERLGRNGRRGYLTHWTEEAVVPRYLEVVRRAAERKGATRIADALAAP
jgi:glycosyltransferase involved in cell wall biosynthesis